VLHFAVADNVPIDFIGRSITMEQAFVDCCIVPLYCLFVIPVQMGDKQEKDGM